MSIIRGSRPATGWYALDKRISEDARLSWAARGLLVFLLGKPDHWQVSVEHLRKQTEGARVRTGRDGIYALLGELQTCGYVLASQARHQDGTLGAMQYLVCEESAVAAPVPAEPDTVNPLPAEPYTAKPTLAKTDTPARTEGEQAPRKRGAVCITLPDWVPVQAWTDWLEARVKMRKPASERAQVLALHVLIELRDAGEDPAAVLNQSTLRGWTGLFTTKNKGSVGNGGASTGRQGGSPQREGLIEQAQRINRGHDEREAGGGLLL